MSAPAFQGWQCWQKDKVPPKGTFCASSLAADCRKYDKLLDEFSSPKEGTKALAFSSKYPKPFMVQFHTVFEKYTAAYWRMPEYNGMRFFYAISVGFLFGAIFWRLG